MGPVSINVDQAKGAQYNHYFTNTNGVKRPVIQAKAHGRGASSGNEGALFAFTNQAFPAATESAAQR